MAALPPRTRLFVETAIRLTRDPASMSSEHIETLRTVASDEEILALVLLIGFFNLATRIADGLGIELDPELGGEPRSGS